MKKNIEIIATVSCVLIMLGAVVLMIFYFGQAEDVRDSSDKLTYIIDGVFALAGGALGAWCVYVLLLGYASLVGNTEKIAKYLEMSGTQNGQQQIQPQGQPQIQPQGQQQRQQQIQP